MTLREKVIAILNEEICSGADRAYGLDQKVADAIIPIILGYAAGVARAEYDICLTHPQGHGLGTARRITLAIEQLGER